MCVWAMQFRMKYIGKETCQTCLKNFCGFFSKNERKATENCFVLSSDVSALKKNYSIDWIIKLVRKDQLKVELKQTEFSFQPKSTDNLTMD